MSPRELEELAAKSAEMIYREILAAFALVRSGMLMKLLAQHLLDKQVEEAVKQVGLEALANAMAKMQTRLPELRQATWQQAAEAFPVPIRTHPLLRETLGAAAIREPTVLEVIRKQDLSRIQGITAETQNAIRDVLANGLAKGTHPTTLAREIRDHIGLTRKGVVNVAKYRAELEGQGRKADQVERMVAKRIKVLINRRARTIAATEVARAQTEGARVQWRRSVTDGILKDDEWEREWVTSHLEGVCPVCVPFDGERATIFGVYISRKGRISNGPTEHPLCMCAERLVPKGFRKGEPTAPARDKILRAIGK